MQIFIMDSDYEVMKKLEELINCNPKYKAKCFTGPQSLVEAVRHETPGAVILDFDMQSSYSAVNTIKRESPDIKIVMMSENKCKAVELFELGLDGFLLKPIEEEKLREQLFRVRHPLLSRIKYGSERTAAI